MLNRLCAAIHNYFDRDKYGEYWDCETGEYTIENGSLTLSFLSTGQYFRIVGSALNDGVYQYPASDLEDETFEGEIHLMKVPKMILDICTEATAAETQYGAALNGPYQSENVIGAYSYTKGANADGTGGIDGYLFGPNGIFATRLYQWRRMT